MIHKTYFVIAVPDLAASGRWYRDALGFEVREIGDPGWRMFVRDACVVMAGECPDATPARELGDHSYFAYLVVDDELDDLFERARAAGADILKEPRDEPWGMREFALRTIDGHRMMIGAEIGT